MSLKRCFNCWGQGFNIWTDSENKTEEKRTCEFCKGKVNGIEIYEGSI